MEKYVKIVYQSEPIGKERIVLYLTTFDKEAFERDNLFQLKEEKERFKNKGKKEEPIPSWFNQEIETQKATIEEQQEIEELLKRYN